MQAVKAFSQTYTISRTKARMLFLAPGARRSAAVYPS